MSSVSPIPFGDDFISAIDFFISGRQYTMMLNAFFDESYNDDIFCVAGYLFVKSRMKKLDAAWRLLLVEYGLRYFRMSECAHRTKEFSKLSRDKCDAISRKAISLIKEYAALGIAVSIKQQYVANQLRQNQFINDPYEICAWGCISIAAIWANQKKVNKGIVYVIEAGDDCEKSTLNLLNRVMSSPQQNKLFKISKIISLPKKEARPCQAADLLAWQFLTELKRREEKKRPIRKDYQSLAELEHQTLCLDNHFVLRLDETIHKERISAALSTLMAS